LPAVAYAVDCDSTTGSEAMDDVVVVEVEEEE
jgi:hypothetical protein